MSIRYRLAVSFLAILSLFGLNLLIYHWSTHKRTASVDALQRAIGRQILLASINQDLQDRRKHVALLSEITTDAAGGGASPEQVNEFDSQLRVIATNLKLLQSAASADSPSLSAKVGKLSSQYGQLSGYWRVFFANVGTKTHATAVVAAIQADPLAESVQRLVLDLEDDQKAEVRRASDNFHAVAGRMDTVTNLIFAFSAVLAIAVAYLISSYLARGLDQLKDGAVALGTGDLRHRIRRQSNDELGELSRTFDDMADKLLSARTELIQMNQELESRHEEAMAQRQEAERLLLNILPAQVAEELRTKNLVDPKYYEDITIIITDFVGFTLRTEKLAAEEVVYILNDYFTAFDGITERYGLEKLKTVGDGYQCVGGLPARSPSHPVDAVLAAFEMVRTVQQLALPDGQAGWPMRIGVHTGPVIAGVVGVRKFAFDIYGDTINFCSRMEATSLPNRINLSGQTHSRVKDFFACEHRGGILTKDRREVDMFFVNGILPGLINGSQEAPPPDFLRRYRIYFQKDPPSFPEFLLRD